MQKEIIAISGKANISKTKTVTIVYNKLKEKYSSAKEEHKIIVDNGDIRVVISIDNYKVTWFEKKADEDELISYN